MRAKSILGTASSHQSSTSCCIASDGTLCAHRASDAVDVSPWTNCLLERTVTEVSRSGGIPKQPHDVGCVVCNLHVADEAPTRFMLSKRRVEESLWQARIQEGDTSKLQSN